MSNKLTSSTNESSLYISCHSLSWSNRTIDISHNIPSSVKYIIFPFTLLSLQLAHIFWCKHSHDYEYFPPFVLQNIHRISFVMMLITLWRRTTYFRKCFDILWYFAAQSSANKKDISLLLRERDERKKAKNCGGIIKF